MNILHYILILECCESFVNVNSICCHPLVGKGSFRFRLMIKVYLTHWLCVVGVCLSLVTVCPLSLSTVRIYLSLLLKSPLSFFFSYHSLTQLTVLCCVKSNPTTTNHCTIHYPSLFLEAKRHILDLPLFYIVWRFKSFSGKYKNKGKFLDSDCQGKKSLIPSRKLSNFCFNWKPEKDLYIILH